ncbi:hypothetical protein AA309_23065 [Microvirga vignae]|uniref:Uncharacterized protein n=1 Tax=Microvirga vignae TaxID=1225564 RepID=A0A0H1R7B5_9HYPH|nr:hypothetical protein AA309_23065 [Microvirga vignae]
MAEAAYIIKKDGRYWFQKRFGAQSGISPGLASHCRVALRAADYRQAVSRMLKVMRMVQSYEIQADIVDRANTLLAEMQRFNATAGCWPEGLSRSFRRSGEKAIGNWVCRAHSTFCAAYPVRQCLHVDQPAPGEPMAKVSRSGCGRVA